MKQFIREMLSGKDDTSIKRVLAFICFLYYYVIYATTYFSVLDDTQIMMSNNIFYMGGGLILGTMFEKFNFTTKK